MTESNNQSNQFRVCSCCGMQSVASDGVCSFCRTINAKEQPSHHPEIREKKHISRKQLAKEEMTLLQKLDSSYYETGTSRETLTVHLALAKLYLEAGDNRACEAELKRTISYKLDEYDVLCADLNSLRGHVNLVSGKSAEAIKFFEKSIHIRRNLIEAGNKEQEGSLRNDEILLSKSWIKRDEIYFEKQNSSPYSPVTLFFVALGVIFLIGLVGLFFYPSFRLFSAMWDEAVTPRPDPPPSTAMMKINERLAREKAADMHQAVFTGDWRKQRDLLEQMDIHASQSGNKQLQESSSKLKADFYDNYPQ